MSDQIIAEDKVAVIHYTLTDDDGKVLDSSFGGPPMAFLAGGQNIVPGLEAALMGKTNGDKVSVVVAPADGYGDRTGPGPQSVKKSEFGKQTSNLHEGRPLRMKASDGSDVTVWVTKMEGSRVWLDADHPLAGKNLHFEVSILEVRDSSEEERAHRHVHGPGGHHH